MWNTKQQTAPTATAVETPMTPTPASDPARPGSPVVRTTAWLGSSIEVKGKISGNEDLHIDGKVEGPISLGNHRLTVGRNGQVSAEAVAREIVVYGKVNGNLRAQDRIEIKKDGSVTGDLSTARIMIEDGAYFKGKIEIDRANKQIRTDSERVPLRAVPPLE
jgi:cytoskeletal protein CcmA (bactofilin family)